MRFDIQAKLLIFFKRPISFVNGLSISKKFILLYVIVFAIPIFAYARYSFNNAENSIKADFYKQSIEELNKAVDSTDSSIKTCQNVAQIAKGSSGFLEFVNKDMTSNDVALIEFKRKEYTQIVNIHEINPSINAIKFFINNDKLYELPPVLNKESKYPDQKFITFIKGLNEKLYFDINSRDKILNGSASIDVVSLFWELIDPGQRHQGFVEVNMPQSTFFKEVYQNTWDENSLLFVFDGVNAENCIVNKNSKFFQARTESFNTILSKISKNASKDKGSFNLRINNENFVVLSEYVESIRTYLFKIYSLEGITQKLYRVSTNIVMFVVIAIIALCLITYISTTILMKKLNRVIASIRKVQAGELSVTVPVKGRDEIDELARHFNNMVFKIKDLISQLLKKQLIAKESEIKALQSQINSHFIYNVLESIRMLAEVEQKHELGDAIFSLGKLMRYSMRWKDQFVSLEEELSLVKNYIFLINLISDFSVELNIKIDEALHLYQIPKMTIQPLVENSVTHGFEPDGKNGMVTINIFAAENSLNIEVMDNGKGIVEDKLNQLNEILYKEEVNEALPFGKNGIGIINVHQRINLFYGKQYGLIIESEKNEYTKVFLRLPFQKTLGGW